jgi:glycosyltransferase involved in cell wall biosynthesis
MDNTSKSIKEEPLVTILVLSYNRAKYIAQAIDSVLAQTYENFELVIIDDGSTDETQEILSTFTDLRIKTVLHTANAGLHTRRAESLTYATGTYTAVLDSDDVWTDTSKLAQQVAYMDAHSECAVVGTFITLCAPGGETLGENSYHTTDQEIRRAILSRNQFTHSSVLLRTGLLKLVPGYRDTGLAEDLDLFLQLGTVGTFANIPQYMTGYRIHTESFNPQKQAMGRAVLGIIQTHKHQYPHYYRANIKAQLRLLYLFLRKTFGV